MGEQTHHGLARARVRLGQTPIHVEPVTDKGVDMPVEAWVENMKNETSSNWFNSSPVSNSCAY